MTTGRINQVAAFIDRAWASLLKPTPVNIRAFRESRIGSADLLRS